MVKSNLSILFFCLTFWPYVCYAQEGPNQVLKYPYPICVNTNEPLRVHAAEAACIAVFHELDRQCQDKKGQTVPGPFIPDMHEEVREAFDVKTQSVKKELYYCCSWSIGCVVP